jgi:catechol 2,3-dioxygenase-like lactoylglutathione lyase family enzyme
MSEPLVQRVSHLLLQVTDLQRAIDFYVGLLGFQVKIEDKLADGRRYVSTLQGLGLTTFPESGGAPHTCDHIAFRCVDGIEPVVERLKAAGVRYQEPRRSPYGNSVYFWDPDGNQLELHDSSGEMSQLTSGT